MSLDFQILSTQDQARCGRLLTPRGAVETPAFMPVATLGAVKGIAPQELAEQGASILLANLYHLALRPGVDCLERLGGLHRFAGWDGPILTDSGGYQVFSLAARRTVDEDGVTFRSHLDGNPVRFTPEGVVEMQQRLGVDICMMLDECLPWPVTEEVAERAWERTLAWARRARQSWSEGHGGLFGITQGSVYRRLRERAAADLVELDFDGYAIGGVSVGEPVEERRRQVEWTVPVLPRERPRYLMGVGQPHEIAYAATQGVDLFDCVLPSRNGRHGILYTRSGLLRIKNARFRDDPLPPDSECVCPVCRRLSRAFLHHLVRAGEITGPVLATVHNLRFYLDFMSELRKAIAAGTITDLAVEVASRYTDVGRAEGAASVASNSRD